MKKFLTHSPRIFPSCPIVVLKNAQFTLKLLFFLDITAANKLTIMYCKTVAIALSFVIPTACCRITAEKKKSRKKREYSFD